MITIIEYVDYGVHGEYGFFGKVVATSDVRGRTVAEITKEIAEMKRDLGDHIDTRIVEEVGAA
jgi:hypothetical protein